MVTFVCQMCGYLMDVEESEKIVTCGCCSSRFMLNVRNILRDVPPAASAAAVAPAVQPAPAPQPKAEPAPRPVIRTSPTAQTEEREQPPAYRAKPPRRAEQNNFFRYIASRLELLKDSTREELFNRADMANQSLTREVIRSFPDSRSADIYPTQLQQLMDSKEVQNATGFMLQSFEIYAVQAGCARSGKLEEPEMGILAFVAKPTDSGSRSWLYQLAERKEDRPFYQSIMETFHEKPELQGLYLALLDLILCYASVSGEMSSESFGDLEAVFGRLVPNMG